MFSGYSKRVFPPIPLPHLLSFQTHWLHLLNCKLLVLLNQPVRCYKSLQLYTARLRLPKADQKPHMIKSSWVRTRLEFRSDWCSGFHLCGVYFCQRSTVLSNVCMFFVHFVDLFTQSPSQSAPMNLVLVIINQYISSLSFSQSLFCIIPQLLILHKIISFMQCARMRINCHGNSGKKIIAKSMISADCFPMQDFKQKARLTRSSVLCVDILCGYTCSKTKKVGVAASSCFYTTALGA